MSQDLHFVKPAIGPTAKLVLLGMLSLVLMMLDNRYAALRQAKAYAASILYPLQWTARQPVLWAEYGMDMLGEKHRLLTENQRLAAENVRLSAKLDMQSAAVRQLEALQSLHRLSDNLPSQSMLAEIVSQNHNLANGRFLINRGSSSGIRTGDPVSDGNGLIGQIAAVYPTAAEVHSVSHAPVVIPAMLERSGVRTLVYGKDGALELRYFPVADDLREGDLLLTSGIDSIYPAGIPLAEVIQADRNSGTPYYRAVLKPAAQLDSSRYVAVIPQKTPFTAPAPSVAEGGRP